MKDPIFPDGGTRILFVLKIRIDFVQQYFDQNPVSHLGLVSMKHGEATQLRALSGYIIKSLTISRKSVAEMCATVGSEFSLHNSPILAGRSLGRTPTRPRIACEAVIITSALSTCNPGYLLTETLPFAFRVLS